MPYNQKAAMWAGLIFGALFLAYGIYMLMFLEHAKKCDPKLSKHDQTFRQVAVVITWIEVVISALSVLGLLIGILSGAGSGISVAEELSYTPMSSMSSMSSMSGL